MAGTSPAMTKSESFTSAWKKPFAGLPGACSGPSQAVLCPHGADFFVCRKLTALSLGQRGVEVRSLSRRKFIERSVDSRELQGNLGEFVLHLVEQGGYNFYGLFK